MSHQVHVTGCVEVFEGVRWQQCGGTYVCNRCERTCGWCFGAADDAPGVCDDCLFAIGHIEDEGDS